MYTIKYSQWTKMGICYIYIQKIDGININTCQITQFPYTF